MLLKHDSIVPIQHIELAIAYSLPNFCLFPSLFSLHATSVNCTIYYDNLNVNYRTCKHSVRSFAHINWFLARQSNEQVKLAACF